MPATENYLIEKIPRKERLALLARCERIELKLGEVLCERGDDTTHAYFPIDGFVSLVTQLDEHPGLEVGMVGREGMLGVQLVLGVGTQPSRALVQGSGAAWRIGVADFTLALAASPALRLRLDRYLYVLMAQLAVSAACLRFHLIGPRLARWLLMSHDRAHADQFHLTQEFLAYMLGVRRVGVTEAAGELQRNGLISYKRGELHVLDRAGLEAAACTCYASGEASYAAVLR